MNISNRYSIELNKISNHLADPERGHIYELTKTLGTPSCASLTQHLKEDIADLLDLIENDSRVWLKKLLRHPKIYNPAAIYPQMNTRHATAYNNQERKCFYASISARKNLYP